MLWLLINDKCNPQNEALKILQTIFAENVPAKTKLEKMQEYGTIMTVDLEREVCRMCNLEESLVARTVAKTIAEQEKITAALVAKTIAEQEEKAAALVAEKEKKIIEEMIKKTMPFSEIAEILGVPIEVIKNIAEHTSQNS